MKRSNSLFTSNRGREGTKSCRCKSDTLVFSFQMVMRVLI